MNPTPQINGFELDQRLLGHPLAEIWRGRSFTGMEVVALVLSEAGSADPQVRDRLDLASRGAALRPGQQQTPLWAANLSTDRPYAITQLVPGQSGAERLLDSLDGLLGNDEESLAAVRSQLAQYGAVPLPPADQPAAAAPVNKIEMARQVRRKIGRWTYLVVVLIVLLVFTVLYSVGAAIGSAVKEQPPVEGPAAAPVSPGPLPSPALLPGVLKAETAAYAPPVPAVGLVGGTYERGADVQVVGEVGLPFAFGWPRPPVTVDLGESSSVLYRRVLTEKTPTQSTLDARIAVHPCKDLAACLAERAAFDKDWTTAFKTPVPATAKDARTWVTVRNGSPYTLTMTHAYTSAGRSWLVGVTVTGLTGEEPAAQRVLNDIWRQTQ
ncbi:hypothetical protein EV644_10311 [Kribbella orskensis]|uniref:Uncharacterized protein n=1 Tax=Kribbella orskensis TaxID=2512216 RepID=A0ABY2BNV6_9ACTN|nr:MULTISPECIES: hypothetical protein [Kribbella]TCN39901.1 hypothetical protein EV642_106409 [Kribbella sp. VKM Ac-2500]TCO27316.1 hypothetical protein EV644_10311 [Kribbella orskensis]